LSALWIPTLALEISDSIDQWLRVDGARNSPDTANEKQA